MNQEQSFRVSVIDPIEPAIGKVKAILFSPFDIGRWFIIGFCAWLAYLGEGGPSFNFNFPFGRSHRHEQLPGRIGDFLSSNLSLVIIIGSIALVVGVIVGLVLLWLNSRGKFMFLDCVAQNKAEVRNPWRKFRQQGNSLFLFRLVVGIIAFICLLFCVGVGVLAVIAVKMYGAKAIIAFVPLLVFVIGIFVLLSIAFWIFFKFTVDFVAPIMYLRSCRCVDGWRQFLSVLSNNKGRFALYILFQIVISLAIGMIITAVICLTCCCACCFLIIPYVGTVLILPLLVFQRAYSLMYLRQYGNQFDVFIPAASVADTTI